ncbi:MAG: coproporphyrinogen dehydrogenase HemZ [Lachnospiraceae bacterium]|nr:coproporphyrinogen dehydrogenase HemZ [Lachnospiraceae bacterium]
MIGLIQNEDLYNYDIRSILQAFFDNEKIVEDILETRFQLKVEYGAEMTKVILIEDTKPEISRTLEGDYTQKETFKNPFKLLIYDILSEYTKKSLPWGTMTGIRPTKVALKLLEEDAFEESILEHYQKEYGTTKQKAKLCLEVAKKEKSLLEKVQYEDGYSLYIGIPFCPSTCLYCSFTSYPIGIYKDKIDAYLDALEKELQFVAQSCSHKKLQTIYIGGGTPTSLLAKHLNRLLASVNREFDLSHLLEFTVEAGRPDSITEDKLIALKEGGVKRISINPQTMNDATLKLIGRNHTSKMVEETYQLARSLGFDNINMDMITGLPSEEIKEVQNTISAITALKPDSITVHSLAIKRAANLTAKRKEFESMIKGSTNEMLEVVDANTRMLGLVPYYLYRQKNIPGNLENVGYALPGKECIYNILIMEEKQDIIAVGAGTSSKFVFPEENRIERVENVKNVEHYMERIDEMIKRKQAFLS